MYEVDPEFAMDRLVKGRLYKFKARNFSYGVWNGVDGFIGIREKFYDHYLFTEYHAATGAPCGTVHAIEAIEDADGVAPEVPDDIELSENFDSRCRQCEQPTEFRPDAPGTNYPGKQYHKDPALDEDHSPHGQTYMPTNWPLFAWLAQFEEDQNMRLYLLRLAEVTPEEAQDLRREFVERREREIQEFMRQADLEYRSRQMAPQTWYQWQMELLGNWRSEEARKLIDLPKEEQRAARKVLDDEYIKRAVALKRRDRER